MVEIDTTSISSKGQIVIPVGMRKDIKEGKFSFGQSANFEEINV